MNKAWRSNQTETRDGMKTRIFRTGLAPFVSGRVTRMLHKEINALPATQLPAALMSP